MINDLYASRLASPLLALDIVLIPSLAAKARDNVSFLLMAVVFCLISVMVVKNIDSYIVQGFYDFNVTVFNYPYFYIFDMEAIYSYTHNSLLIYL